MKTKQDGYNSPHFKDVILALIEHLRFDMLIERLLPTDEQSWHELVYALSKNPDLSETEREIFGKFDWNNDRPQSHNLKDPLFILAINLAVKQLLPEDRIVFDRESPKYIKHNAFPGSRLEKLIKIACELMQDPHCRIY